MNVRGSKTENLIEYALIIALYYVTGGAFSYTMYSTQITVFFITSLLICFLTKRHKKMLTREAVFVWFAMSFFLMIVPFLHSDSISTYLAISMQLAIGMFCSAVIPINEFKKKYIYVIVFFAGISLVGWGISFLYPSLALRFPLTIGGASVDYYNAGLYVFMRLKGYGPDKLVLTNRNSGICWEPGCYQAFLNIALLFLLEREKQEHQQHFFLYFSILVVTVLTTVSTTGIIILCFLLIVYSREWSKGIKFAVFFVPCVLLVSLWSFYNTFLGDVLQEKLDREFGQELHFFERISLDRINYMFSENGTLRIFGMSFAKWLTYGKSLWNSVIHSFLCLGIPFTLIQIVGYWRGCKAIVKKSTALFVIMIMCASSETLFWRVFFNTIAFYGWKQGLNCDKVP